MIKYTKEKLELIIKDSVSLSEVCRKLGKTPYGYQHTYITGLIRKFNIDTSHFLGQRANSGKNHKGGSSKILWNKLLVDSYYSNRRILAKRLRTALIEMGREYRCVECNNIGIWKNKKMILEIDHINNNPFDNRPNNLRFLCPNCHAVKSCIS